MRRIADRIPSVASTRDAAEATIFPPQAAAPKSGLDVHAAIYDAPLPARRLPPLRSALIDPAVESCSPSSLLVPTEVLDTLAKARRVLVVSHTPPDGDCVGSALGLARALRALGKEAAALVDAPLSGRLRNVAGDELLRAEAALSGVPYELVVLVDVAQADRIGEAARALPQASSVLVIDHHYVEPSGALLGLREDARFFAWVAPGLESASLQVASCVDALAARLGRSLEGDARVEVMRPLATGLYTDTDGFKLPGASREALRMMKHLAGQLAPSPLEGLAEIERDLRYQLPVSAIRVLDEGVLEHHVSHPRATVLRVPLSALEAALEAARADDPRAISDDVRGVLLDRLDLAAARDGLAVLLLEAEGQVRVSVRSREPGAAANLVEESFPGCGGGKAHAAGALVVGDVESVEARLDAYFKRRRENQLLRLGINPGRR